jgi:hypothetical protein
VKFDAIEIGLVSVRVAARRVNPAMSRTTARADMNSAESKILRRTPDDGSRGLSKRAASVKNSKIAVGKKKSAVIQKPCSTRPPFALKQYQLRRQLRKK